MKGWGRLTMLTACCPASSPRVRPGGSRSGGAIRRVRLLTRAATEGVRRGAAPPGARGRRQGGVGRPRGHSPRGRLARQVLAGVESANALIFVVKSASVALGDLPRGAGSRVGASQAAGAVARSDPAARLSRSRSRAPTGSGCATRTTSTARSRSWSRRSRPTSPARRPHPLRGSHRRVAGARSGRQLSPARERPALGGGVAHEPGRPPGAPDRGAGRVHRREPPGRRPPPAGHHRRGDRGARRGDRSRGRRAPAAPPGARSGTGREVEGAGGQRSRRPAERPGAERAARGSRARGGSRPPRRRIRSGARWPTRGSGRRCRCTASWPRRPSTARDGVSWRARSTGRRRFGMRGAAVASPRCEATATRSGGPHSPRRHARRDRLRRPDRARRDSRSGRQLAVLRGAAGLVVSPSFSPDGGRVLAASSDHIARIWDAGTRAGSTSPSSAIGTRSSTRRSTRAGIAS